MRFDNQKEWMDQIREKADLFVNLILISPTILAQKEFLRSLIGLEQNKLILKEINRFAKSPPQSSTEE